jgi:hypothetical protein
MIDHGIGVTEVGRTVFGKWIWIISAQSNMSLSRTDISKETQRENQEF